MISKKIIVALDSKNLNRTIKLVKILKKDVYAFKIGYQFFFNYGLEGYKKIYSIFPKVFLDLKLHDIPNTVKKSIEGLKELPIKMLTIHTSGGKDMMIAAMEAVKGTPIKIFGVTLLTSLSDDETNEIYKRSSFAQVNAMLDLAELANIHGVVCSPHELELVSKRKDLLSITPGIRLKDSSDDQKRVMTPKEAIDLGSDYLVIGRPITASENINKSLNEIYKSIK